MLNDSDSSYVAHQMIVQLQSRLDPIIEQLRPKIVKEGTKWMCLYGDNIVEGICGFGDTPALACCDFVNNWYGQRLTLPSSKGE